MEVQVNQPIPVRQLIHDYQLKRFEKFSNISNSKQILNKEKNSFEREETNFTDIQKGSFYKSLKLLQKEIKLNYQKGSKETKGFLYKRQKAI